MGSPHNEKDRDGDEGPVHTVTISKPYYLGVYEVTQAQWTAVMKSNPSKYQDRPDHPVETVSWGGLPADSCRDLTHSDWAVSGCSTEAEWEYACRAGTMNLFLLGR